MLPAVLILLLVTLLLGAAGFVVGLRGRRINDHPVCSWCKFDLDGVYPESVTCPECGAGLKRDKAVLNGVRKRMPVLAAVGAVLAATSVLPFCVVGYAAITGGDINKFKPLGLLLWEGKLADAARGTKLADEIMTRVLAGKLDAGQYQRVIKTALEIQGDRSKPWSESWGELIERARFDSVLSPADEQVFAAQAPVFEIKTRETVNAGGPVPIMIKLKEARVGASTSMFCPVRVGGVSLGGRALALPAEAPGPSDPFTGARASGDGQWMLSIGGSRAGGARGVLGGSNSYGMVVAAPADAAKGLQPLEATLAISPGSDMGGLNNVVMILNGRLQRAGSGAKPSNSTALKLASTVDVRPAEEPVAVPVAPDREIAEKLGGKLRPEILEPSGQFGHAGVLRSPQAAYALRFDCADLPAEVSYDVFVKNPAGGETLLGSFCSGKAVDEVDDPFVRSFQSSMTISINGSTISSSSRSSSAESRTVSGVLPFKPGRSVDVVLRPSPSHVAVTLDQSKYCDLPLEFKGVPVQRDPFEEMNARMQEQIELMRRGRGQPVPRAPRKAP
ncbi:MAG: hypothetical protein ACOYN0_03955 [Phycisphaerales bacterium]